MEQCKYDVFVSYRRKGGSEKAQLVKSELKQRGCTDERIFLDTHSLHDGDFEQKIKVAIEQSQSVVVIISKGCFDEIKETDFWYMEIKEALLQRKKVIPIFFDGFTSFAALNVPQELVELTKMNAVIYQHEYADAAFDKLVMFIGLQKEAYPTKKRGCLFSLKYKGCLMSVALVGLVVFVLAPITFMQFGSVRPYPAEDDRVSYAPNVVDETECSPDEERECYAPNDANVSVCPPDFDEREKLRQTSKPGKVKASPEKKDVELCGRWQGLHDDLFLSFQAGDVIMEKRDSGIVMIKRGDYRVRGNLIVFNWKGEEKQTVRYEIGGKILRLTFDDGMTIILYKH